MNYDAGAYRLLAYAGSRPSTAKAELAEVRQHARALKRVALLARRPAPAAPISLPGLFQAIQGILATMAGWLSSFVSVPVPPAPLPPPPVPPSPLPPAGPAPSGRAARFTVSSYNILGSDHTKPGADAEEYAAGPTRIRWAVQLLEAKGVDVVGFQEMARDQAAAFLQAAGGTYGLFPGNGKKAPFSSHNSIAWRKDTWDMVKASMVDMVGHKGRTQPSPVVRLRHKTTGEEVLFLNFHNAPGYRTGTQQHNRDQARAAQVELVSRLQRETGLPVVVTGDMNEKDVYFRDMTQQAGMHAANQGPGGKAPRQMGIDWIFGSAAVKFSRFLRERGPLGKKVSDHAMLVTEVSI